MVNSENKTKMLIKDTFFNKSQKKASRIGQILGGFFWLFLVGFFWLDFFIPTLYRRGAACSADIMSHFYNKAEELGKLDAVLQLSITSKEEN